jgi:hypothetical protein
MVAAENQLAFEASNPASQATAIGRFITKLQTVENRRAVDHTNELLPVFQGVQF